MRDSVGTSIDVLSNRRKSGVRRKKSEVTRFIIEEFYQISQSSCRRHQQLSSDAKFLKQFSSYYRQDLVLVYVEHFRAPGNVLKKSLFKS